ncbi:MAG: RNA polymerase sigma factor [Gammaproteobacteria bacterium]
MAGFLDKKLDDALVRAAQRGDRKAHEVIYRTFSGPVYTLARRMLRNSEAADEILQETFLEVLRKLKQYRFEAPLGAWIRRIAVNKSLMHMRSYWNRFRDHFDASLESQFGTLDDQAARELDIRSAMDLLSAPARVVLWLHTAEGYTHEEIGNMLGKSPSYSKSQLARALEKLRATLHVSKQVKQCTQTQNSC